MAENNTPELKDGEIDLCGDGGIIKKITKEGEGDLYPSAGCKVSLHYTVKLEDGKLIDSSHNRNQLFEFDVEKESVIKCFDIAVTHMKKGEHCSIVCSPDYGYGESGSPPEIPPNAILKVELELVDWKGEDLSPKLNFGIERFVMEKGSDFVSPSNFDKVKIHIAGKYNGNTFDERDVEFNLGEGSEFNIISGIEDALPKFHLGQTCRLIIKSEYAFGAEGNKEFNIPGDATVEYIVTLNEFLSEPQIYDLEYDECINLAQKFKEKGTIYYKEKKYDLALKMYDNALKYLSHKDLNDGDKPLKVAVYLNTALVYQMLNDCLKSKLACNNVLEIDENNIKGLYRRGQAYFDMGDIDNALIDFEKVKEIDPQNKSAINKITICEEKLKEYRIKEKKIYANMFEKFALLDHQKEQKDRSYDGDDVLQDCGEWGTGDGEDDDYEADMRKQVNEIHPNIVMLNGL